MDTRDAAIARAEAPRRATRKLGDDNALLQAAMLASSGYVAVKLIALPILSALARLFRGAPAPTAALVSAFSAAQGHDVGAAIDLPRGEDRWKELEQAPMACPDDYKPVTTTNMPCSVHDFYDHILSGKSSFFPDVHTRIGKQWGITMQRYRAVSVDHPAPEAEDQSLLGSTTSVFDFVAGKPVPPAGYTRTFAFVNPKKPPSSVDSLCVQRQQVAMYAGGHLVFATAQNMLNIPFRNDFVVCTFWQVQPAATGVGCTITISLKVHFLKRVWVGSIINLTTFRETGPFFRGFLEAAKILVESMPPVRRGAVGLLTRQCSLAMGALAGTPPLAAHVQHTGDESRLNVATRRFGDGGTLDLVEQLPLTHKQVKALLVFLVLSAVLMLQLHVNRELQQHMRRGGLSVLSQA